MKLILKYHCHLKAETTNTKVIFGEAKEYMGLRVAKFRRLWNVDEQFLLTATAQNIKKMAKLLHRGNKEAREAIQGMANRSNYAINGLGLLFFKNNPADNILLLLAHEGVWEKNDFFSSLLILKTVFGIKTFGFWNLDFLFLLNYLWPDFAVALVGQPFI